MDVSAYLERIGYRGPLDPTLRTLRRLHRAHLLAVPFENLDVLAGRPIVLEPEALFEKIITRRRGGFCYELNGLFAALLGELSFRVDPLSARAICADGSFGPPFDHLALAVHLDETWLADVGFGAAFAEPIHMVRDRVQVRDGVSHRLVERGDDWLYQMREKGETWSDRYLFTQKPRRLEEFEGMCRFHQSSPESPFTSRRICSRATPNGRVTIARNRLIRTLNGVRTEREIAEDEVPGLLRDDFGIEGSDAR